VGLERLRVEAYCPGVEGELLLEVVLALVVPSHAKHEAAQTASIDVISVLAADGLAPSCRVSA